MTAPMSYTLFSGVATPETAMGIIYNCLVGALPYSHYAMRSFPLCGVRVLHPAQNDLTSITTLATAKKKNKKKTGTLVVVYNSSRSDWHV